MTEYENHNRLLFIIKWFKLQTAPLGANHNGFQTLFAANSHWIKLNPGLAARRRVEYRQQRERA
jgi:hypothetical protein